MVLERIFWSSKGLFKYVDSSPVNATPMGDPFIVRVNAQKEKTLEDQAVEKLSRGRGLSGIDVEINAFSLGEAKAIKSDPNYFVFAAQYYRIAKNQ